MGICIRNSFNSQRLWRTGSWPRAVRDKRPSPVPTVQDLSAGITHRSERRIVLTGQKYFSKPAASGASQRSGLNSAASGPQSALDVWRTYGLIDRTVPSGKVVSSKVTPPLGATRGRPTRKMVISKLASKSEGEDSSAEWYHMSGVLLGTGAKIRKASLIAA